MISIERRLTTTPKPMPPVSDLKFGKHFSDHMFVARYSDGKGWFDARIEPYGPLQIDPGAAVLHYGQALFEGMKAFRRTKDGEIVVFRPEFNVHRMHEGAERLCMHSPPKDLFLSGLKELIDVDKHWVPEQENCSLYIRPTLIGTEGFLGVRASRDVMFFIILSPVGPYYAKGQGPTRIWVEDKAIRAAPGGLGATKAGANYAASLQSGAQAKEKGFDQVLWLDVAHDGIEEVGTMNVFFVFKGEVVTPKLNGSILAGGMRDSVIQILRKEGHTVNERRVTMSELVEKHKKGELLEAFGTGTAAIISPIGELCYKGDPMMINQGKTGTVSDKLFHTITDLQRGVSEDPFGWIVPYQKMV